MLMLKQRSMLRIIFNRKMLFILLLGIASGLPLALCGGATMQLWYYEDGNNIKTITLLSLASQPYVFKFLWAPAVDYIRPPIFTKRKGWIFITQGVVASILLCMSALTPSKFPIVLLLLAFLLSFFAATQDIAIDAFRSTILRAEELGVGAAWATAGYRFGMIISNGVALSLAYLYGFQRVYFLMAVLMLSFMLVTIFIKEKNNDIEIKRHVNILMPIKEFLSRSYALRMILLIISYKLGATLLEGILSVFLREIDFSLVDIGFIGKTISIGSTIVGAFIGGMIITKLGLYRSLLSFGLIQAISMLLYVALACVGNNYYLLIIASIIEHVCGGTATAAYLSLMMAMCNKELAGTQLAIFTAISAIGRVYAALITGFIVKRFGWSDFFLFCIVVSLCGVWLLVRLKKDILEIQTIKENAIT